MRALARRLTRALAVPLAYGALAASPAPARAAGDTPVMYFTFSFTASYNTICGHGQVQGAPAVAPVWQVFADGTQLPTGPAITGSAASGGQTGLACVTVYTTAPEGTYVVTFAFLDQAMNPAGPVPYAIAAHCLWAPGNNGSCVYSES